MTGLQSSTSSGSPEYYLGVDGGGSKTLAVIVDGDGQEQGRGQAGSSNYQAAGVTFNGCLRKAGNLFVRERC